MDTELAQYLKRLPLFKNVPENVLAQIASKIQTHHLVKGDVVIREGDPGHSLFIMRSGWAKIVASSGQGGEVVLNQFGPGQVIGEMSLTSGAPSSASVITLSSATVFEISNTVILDVISQQPALAISLLTDMSERLRFANTYIQKAVEWSQQIADGNYSFVLNQVKSTQATIVDMGQSDEARAGAFLSAFFKLIEGVKKREESLKQQVRQLTIQIDEAKRQKAVEEITETDFFEDLQASAKRMRQLRQEKTKKRSD